MNSRTPTNSVLKNTVAIMAAARASTYYKSVIEQTVKYPENICNEYPLIACSGLIKRHTDMDFPEFSAFLCLRNDGCRVWQIGGYKGLPKEGERFVLNIHRQHGVQAKDDQTLVMLYADGNTENSALRNLRKVERDLLRGEL